MFCKHELYYEDILSVAQVKIPWNKLRNKKILITGATGMIGCFLVDVLMYRNHSYNDNITIYALGRNMLTAKQRFTAYWGTDNFFFLQHDINEPLVGKGEFDFIIHAASNTHPVAYASDPVGTVTTNIIGTYNLLQHAVHHRVERFVFLSSVEIYGENRGDIEKFDEGYCGYIDCNTLRAGYPESKRAGEALCNAFIHKYGLDIVIPRLSRTYGPTMTYSDSKAIAQFIKNGVAGEDIILKSEGNQLYSYCYVADAVSAILTILLCGVKGEAYNIADSRSDITLKELAEIVAKLSKTNMKFQLPNETEIKGFSKATKAVMDSKKIIDLEWHANFDIKGGLKRTIEILKSRRMKEG